MTSAKEIPYENKEEKLIYEVKIDFECLPDKQGSINKLKEIGYRWAVDLIDILERK